MSTYPLTTGTHHCDPLMAMCQHTAIQHTLATLATPTTTMVMWPMKEDIQHLEILTYRKILKRREIETTNPLEISTQVSLKGITII